MRTSIIVISSLHLIMSIVFIALGTISFVVFGNHAHALYATTFIAENPQLVRWLGGALAIFGMFWLAVFAFLNRKGSYDVLIKKGRLWTVDADLVRAYIEKFYRTSFGEVLELKDVFFDSKGNLRIATQAQVPDEPQEKKRLERFSLELAPMLREILGFRKEIIITVVKD